MRPANMPLLPHETAPIASGAYTWLGDGKILPIMEEWAIHRALTGYLLTTTADASTIPDFGHRYTATLSVDADRRPTALAMEVTKGGHTVAVSANLEVDAAVMTRVLTSVIEGAVQRTQTFRMEPGYTIEAHPVFFDGLHIAACDRTASVPCRLPCLWLDVLTDDPQGLMAARPTTYAIDRRPPATRETYALTRWGNDLELAESLLTVKRARGWIVPTALRFTMGGVLYSAQLTDEQWVDEGEP